MAVDLEDAIVKAAICIFIYLWYVEVSTKASIALRTGRRGFLEGASCKRREMELREHEESEERNKA